MNFLFGYGRDAWCRLRAVAERCSSVLVNCGQVATPRIAMTIAIFSGLLFNTGCPYAAVPGVSCHGDDTGMRLQFVAVGLWLAGERQPRDDGGKDTARCL